MNQKEILTLLQSKGIIIDIAGDYILTEKYKTLLDLEKASRSATQVTSAPPNKEENSQVTLRFTQENIETLSDSKTAGNNWPEEVLESVGRTRANALMNACEIPTTDPAGLYRLRGLDKSAVNILSNIVDDKDGLVNPGDFIRAVRTYYKYTEKPKSFKNLINDHDIFDIYEDYIQGRLFKGRSNTDKHNSSWR